MPISNSLALPSALSNGTTADATQVMGDFNYLLAALNRALLDSGGGNGVNAQNTQIHNLSAGTSSGDAVNLGQLSSYAALAAGSNAFTGAMSIAGALTAAAITASALITGNAGFSGTTLSLSSTLSVSGASTLAGLNATTGAFSSTLSASGAATFAAVTASGLITGNAGFSGTTLALSGAATLNNGITATGTVTTGTHVNSIGYLGVPPNAQSASYVLVLADAGKSIDLNVSNGTVTIPANASVAFEVGTTIMLTNLNASNLTVAIGGTDTLTWAGSTTTGSRTLAQNGMATIRKVGTTSWLITGVGLS